MGKKFGFENLIKLFILRYVYLLCDYMAVRNKNHELVLFLFLCNWCSSQVASSPDSFNISVVLYEFENMLMERTIKIEYGKRMDRLL